MSLDSDPITNLLRSFSAGTQTIESVREEILRLKSMGPESVDTSVRIDLDRAKRCGYAEVIYAPGKSNEALLTGFQALLDAGQNCLATRCTPEQAALLVSSFPEAVHHELARTVRIQQAAPTLGEVAVVTAGTSDQPVALEALETLRWMNVNASIYMDVGVAGPQRFLQIKDQLTDCNAVVVVAGMEGALPSVVAGWLDCPIIALPTSVGYGAAFGGVAALLGMLNSCAANVAVVNIDAGFKAGYLAGMIAQQGKAVTA